MKAGILVTLSVLVLAGCASKEFAYKPGSTPQMRGSDMAQCSRQALEAFPIDRVVRRAPVYYQPGRPICRYGRCYMGHGGFYGGETRIVDVNARLRETAFGQCLAARGYQSVALPPCSGAVREALARSTQKRFPPLGSESCVVTMRDGSIKVYSP